MAATNDNIYARDGGVWRRPYEVWGRDGGVWRDVQEVWARDGGLWRHSWIKSDPQTYLWNATWSQTYAQNYAQIDEGVDGAILEGDLLHGYWDVSWGWNHVTGLIGFDDVDIRAKLAVRPAIISCRLRLTNFSNWDTYDGGTKVKIGTHNNASKPTTFVHTHTNANFTTSGFMNNNTVWTTISNTIATKLRDNTAKGIMLHENADGTSGSMKSLYRGGWRGVNGTVPQLEITCDYS